jgi:hypothetical protein
VANRAESNTPAIPITRSFGNPVTRKRHMGHGVQGVRNMIKIALGECFATCSETIFTMPALMFKRSSRLMPGFRGTRP